MLEALNLKNKLSKAEYARLMPPLQERLRHLQYQIKEAEIPVIICMQGWNTSGRGRVIKKLTEKLDPRMFRAHPGKPPTKLERGYHFLWRYQIALPNSGEIALFDHSWYGRVLIERCDKLTPAKEWREAYHQINEFEELLTDDGQVLLKLWMHISKAEQKKRYRECERDPVLKWKITKEYKRQHRHYDEWAEAAEDMLAKTNTANAPWSVIEANDLNWARVRVFELLVKRWEEALARKRQGGAKVAPKAEARHA
jgi:polyphosphate kinase 2 (PPK2 family)